MAGQIVNWVLNLQGNFTAQVNAAKTALAGLSSQVNLTAKNLNSNQTVSTFESLASILIPFGGAVSKVGILASTAARPLSVLTDLFGASALAAGAATIGVGLLAVGLAKAAFAANDFVASAVDVRASLVQHGELASDAAQNLVDYGQATDRLTLALEKLHVALADQLAPAFTTLIDAGTGFVRVLEDIADKMGALPNSIPDWVQNMLGTGMVGATFTMARAGVDVLAQVGQGSDVPIIINPETDAEKRRLDLLQGAAEGDDSRRRSIAQKGDQQIDQRAIKARSDAETLKAKLEALNDQKKAAEQEAFRKIQAAQDRIEDMARERREREKRDAEQAQREADADARAAAAQEKRDQAEQQQIAAREAAGHLQGLSGLASGLSGGGVSGVLGAAGAGPVGAIVAALGDKGTPRLLEDLIDQVKDLYTNLPEVIGDIAGDVVPDLLRAMPEIAAQFSVLGPEIAASLVEASPELFSSLIEAMIELPDTFAQKILELPDKIGEAVAHAISHPLQIGGGKHPALGAELIGGALGFGLGGPIGALAGATAGAGIFRATHHQGGGHNFHINLHSPNIRSVANEFQQALGSFGLNVNLDPFGS